MVAIYPTYPLRQQRERGRVVRPVAFSIADDQREALEALAVQEGHLNRSIIVRAALDEYIARNLKRDRHDGQHV